MREASRKSNQATLWDMDDVTSLAESSDGILPCDSPDGQTSGQSGLAPAPVSRSAKRAKGKAKRTTAIYGLNFFASSPSNDLQSFLASKSRQTMGEFGSPEYVLIWRQWDMESGPPICAVRARRRRTSDNVCSGWPTPDAAAFEAVDLERLQARRKECKERTGNGNGFGLTIGQAVPLLVGWPTPDHHHHGMMNIESTLAKMAKTGRAKNQTNLEDVVALTGRATPSARDWKDGRASQETLDKNSRPLNEQAVMFTGWMTPTVNDAKGSTCAYANGNHETPVLKLPGQTLSSSRVLTANTGESALNPAMSRWLMGYPQRRAIQGWDCCSPGWKEWEETQRILAELSSERDAIASGDSGGTEIASAPK